MIIFSIYDFAINIIYPPDLSSEENPIAWYILNKPWFTSISPHVNLLLFKAFGTILAFTFILVFAKVSNRLSTAVFIGLTILLLYLLAYLIVFSFV